MLNCIIQQTKEQQFCSKLSRWENLAFRIFWLGTFNGWTLQVLFPTMVWNLGWISEIRLELLLNFTTLALIAEKTLL